MKSEISWFAWFPIVLAACAPVRLPHAPRSPMIDRQGDVAVSGAGSFQGVQLDATYAFTDLMAARLGYHTRIQKGKIYHVPTAGFGLYSSTDNWRFGAFVDGGGGYAFNRDSVTISSGDETSTTTTTLAGGLGQAGLTLHAGTKQKWTEQGVELQFTYTGVSHNKLSDAGGGAHDLSLLPIGFARVGNEFFQAGVFLGVDIPLYRQGEMGQPFPLLLGANLQFKFHTRPAELPEEAPLAVPGG